MAKTTVKRRATHRAIRFSVMRDERLSIEARGLLALLLTHAERWEFNRKDIMKKCKCSEGKYDRMRRELIEFKYLSIDSIRDDKGRIRGWVWELNDDPTTPEVQNLENPRCGKTGAIRETPKGVNNIQVRGRENANKKAGLRPADFPEKQDVDEAWDKYNSKFIKTAGKAKVAPTKDKRAFIGACRRSGRSPKDVGAAVLAFMRENVKSASAPEYRKTLESILKDDLYETYFISGASPIVDIEDAVAIEEREQAAFLAEAAQ